MQLNVEETLWGRSWVSSKHTHMGHGSHQSAVLDDGAARHSGHDAAGGVQQVRVGDLQDQVPSVGAGAAFEDLHVEKFHSFAADIAEDPGRAGADLAGLGHGQGLAGPFGPGAEDPEGGVGPQGADGAGRFHGTLQLPRLAAAALFHRFHRGLVDPAPGHGGELAPAAADAVAQCAEAAPVRVIIGHGADARDPLPDVDPQPGTVGGGRRGKPDLVGLAVPAQLHRHRAAGALQGLVEVRRIVDGPAVQGHDLVADLHPGLPGRTAVGLMEGRHRHGPLA